MPARILLFLFCSLGKLWWWQTTNAWKTYGTISISSSSLATTQSVKHLNRLNARLSNNRLKFLVTANQGKVQDKEVEAQQGVLMSLTSDHSAQSLDLANLQLPPNQPSNHALKLKLCMSTNQSQSQKMKAYSAIRSLRKQLT